MHFARGCFFRQPLFLPEKFRNAFLVLKNQYIHFMKVTCGIYLYNTRSKKILVCHATNSSWKTWSVPKGLKDPGEDSFTAAVRELKEETGIDIKELNVLGVYTLPPVKYQKQNKVLESFLVITDTSPDEYSFHCHSMTDKGLPEIDSWKWIGLDTAGKYLHESQLKNTDQIAELILAG